MNKQCSSQTYMWILVFSLKNTCCLGGSKLLYSAKVICIIKLPCHDYHFFKTSCVLHSPFLYIVWLQELKDKAQQLKESRNTKFKQQCYSESIDDYTEALSICPLCYKKERAIMYSNRAAAHVYLVRAISVDVFNCYNAIQVIKLPEFSWEFKTKHWRMRS